MAQRLVIRIVDQSAAKKDPQFPITVLLFVLPPIMLALVAAVRNDNIQSTVAAAAAFNLNDMTVMKNVIQQAVTSWSLLLDQRLWWSCVFGGSLLVFIFLLGRNLPLRQRHRARENLEFVLSVYPAGVQLPSSSKGVPGTFIPRDAILDCCVHQVILAHRVYSSPRIQRRRLDGTNDTDMVELFPEVELSYSECSAICSKLGEMLRLRHPATTR